MKNLQAPQVTATILAIIGAINWAMVGIVDLDIIAFIFGIGSPITRAIDILIGMGGVYLAANFSTFIRRPNR